MGILRLLLALSVLSVHSGSILGCRFVGGQIAVQAFYIISGFYMSLILNEKYINANNSYRLFITNRILRLYPIYLTILFLSVLVFATGIFSVNVSCYPNNELFALITNLPVLIFLIIVNVVILGQDWVLFLGYNTGNGTLYFTDNFASTYPHLYSYMFVPQAWSLGIELIFYSIAPFVVKKNLKTQMIIILFSMIIRLFIYNTLNLRNDPWTYRFFPTELLFFLLGSVAYQLKNKITNIRLQTSYIVILLIYIILFTVFFFELPSLKVNYIPFSLRDILYFVSVMLAIPILFLYFKNKKIENKIGDLSYPVYISHKLIIMILATSSVAWIKNGWFVALVTIAFSILLNRWITVPIEKIRQSRIRKNI